MGNAMRVMVGLLALAAAGCASVKVPQPTGGSRADGVVELSYEFGMFEDPQVDMSAAGKSAAARCAAWGYENAEAFGGTESRCQRTDAYGGCVRTFATIRFQCTNTGERVSPAAPAADSGPVQKVRN